MFLEIKKCISLMLLAKVEYTTDNPMKQQIKFPIRIQQNNPNVD